MNKEEIINKWKKEWLINKESKVWWTKIVDEVWDNSKQETLKQVKDTIDSGRIECMSWGNQWWMKQEELKKQLEEI